MHASYLRLIGTLFFFLLFSLKYGRYSTFKALLVVMHVADWDGWGDNAPQGLPIPAFWAVQAAAEGLGNLKVLYILYLGIP